MQGHPIDLDSGETKINGDVSIAGARFKRDSVSRQHYKEALQKGKFFHLSNKQSRLSLIMKQVKIDQI